MVLPHGVRNWGSTSRELWTASGAVLVIPQRFQIWFNTSSYTTAAKLQHRSHAFRCTRLQWGSCRCNDMDLDRGKHSDPLWSMPPEMLTVSTGCKLCIRCQPHRRCIIRVPRNISRNAVLRPGRDGLVRHCPQHLHSGFRSTHQSSRRLMGKKMASHIRSSGWHNWLHRSVASSKHRYCHRWVLSDWSSHEQSTSLPCRHL